MCPTPVADEMTSPRRFFSMPISHYCVAVDRMLAFKGLAVEHVRVPYHDKTELLKETGQDYVPALLWDGNVVPWAKIPAFLEAQQPEPTLYPKGWGPVATVLEQWGHDVLEEKVWRAVVTEVPATFTDARERWVFEELQTRGRGPWHVLERRREEFTSEALETLAMVDRMLADRAWVLGEPSLADFGIYGGLSPWLAVGRTIPRDMPHLTRWVDQIRALGAPRPASIAGSDPRDRRAQKPNAR